MTDKELLQRAFDETGIKYVKGQTIGVGGSEQGHTISLGDTFQINFDNNGSLIKFHDRPLDARIHKIRKAEDTVRQITMLANAAPAMKMLAELRKNEPDHPTISYIDEMLNSGSAE